MESILGLTHCGLCRWQFLGHCWSRQWLSSAGPPTADCPVGEDIAENSPVLPTLLLAVFVFTETLSSFFPRSVAGLDKEADLVHMEVRTADGCESREIFPQVFPLPRFAF